MKPLFKGLLFFSFLFIFACNLGFTPDSYYYIQQSKPDKNEDNIPTEDIELSLNYMFDILEDSGKINQIELESLLDFYENELSADDELLSTFFKQLYELPAFKKYVDPAFPVVDFLTFDFNSQIIQAEFTSKNVPLMRYSSNSSWELSDNSAYLPALDDEKNKYTYEYKGENSVAGVNPITNVLYYMYKGFNPFFSIDSSYNNELLRDGSESGMSRFLFYRFTGKGGGIVNLDNMLVAVDTNTSLVFCFAVPTEFETLLGQDSPTKWEAVEVAASAPDGNKYKFYEYDPAGYIDASGNFVMYEWYTENLSKANKANQTLFYPQFTGVSPYLVNFDIVKPTLTSSSGEDSAGYYTEISIEFNYGSSVSKYNIYRIDDSSTERTLIDTIDAGQTYKDYNALILTKYPTYMVEALDSNGVVIGNPSSFEEGRRNLTERETVLAAMESIRYALVNEKLFSLFVTNKAVTGSNGGEFKYVRKGLFSNSYTFTLTDYTPNFLSISTLENKEIQYSSDEVLSIKTKNPFTGVIAINGSSEETITLNNIIITNNDKNIPTWEDGTFDYSKNSMVTSFSSNGEDSVPFALFMDKENYIRDILGDDNIYIQK